jgi:hypothetical protein
MNNEENTLVDDVVVLLFRLLPTLVDRCAAYRVCRQWRRAHQRLRRDQPWHYWAELTLPPPRSVWGLGRGRVQVHYGEEKHGPLRLWNMCLELATREFGCKPEVAHPPRVAPWGAGNDEARAYYTVARNGVLLLPWIHVTTEVFTNPPKIGILRMMDGAGMGLAMTPSWTHAKNNGFRCDAKIQLYTDWGALGQVRCSFVWTSLTDAMVHVMAATVGYFANSVSWAQWARPETPWHLFATAEAWPLWSRNHGGCHYDIQPGNPLPMAIWPDPVAH